MRILLVETDRTVKQGLVAVLKAASMVVDAVDTGEEALEYCRLCDFDMVLLDTTLPDTDGYDVLRRLRAARLSTPVIILADGNSPQAKVKGFAAGADDGGGGAGVGRARGRRRSGGGSRAGGGRGSVGGARRGRGDRR